jgi:phosphate:Na+ symporter
MILLGFATLMFGMESMSGAVSGLRNVSGFQNLFIMFKNPLLGVLAGAVLTAIIQSSSASVGILQALAVTGQVSYGAAIPIIMGQNIGTCVTAMISSVGANKNAKRAAMVHLSFNVIGTAVWLTVFSVIKVIFRPLLLDAPATLLGIAIAHSVFNALCTVLILPFSDFLEKLVIKLVPDSSEPEVTTELDERLLAAPAIAMERCHDVAVDMAKTAVKSLKEGMALLSEYSPETARSLRDKEEKTDHYEDILSTYLVKLSTRQISESDRAESAKLLKMIGDFERISDHAVNLLGSSEEMKEKNLKFTGEAELELNVITSAVAEILDLALNAFINNDVETAAGVEPLEQVIDNLKEQLRTRHILRLQQGDCTMDAGFIWSDILTNLERTSDHCSNIAGCIMDLNNSNMNFHELVRNFREESEEFTNKYKMYRQEYRL